MLERIWEVDDKGILIWKINGEPIREIEHTGNMVAGTIGSMAIEVEAVVKRLYNYYVGQRTIQDKETAEDLNGFARSEVHAMVLQKLVPHMEKLGFRYVNTGPAPNTEEETE